MVPLFPSEKIYIARSNIPKAGRGVFARDFIYKDEVIERCPVIEIPKSEAKTLRKTQLKNYYFLWGEHLDHLAICLGFGSIYNHSYTPNATYVKNIEDQMIEFIALENIGKDIEITVNYNFGNPDDKSPLWIKEIPPESA